MCDGLLVRPWLCDRPRRPTIFLNADWADQADLGGLEKSDPALIRLIRPIRVQKNVEGKTVLKIRCPPISYACPENRRLADTVPGGSLISRCRDLRRRRVCTPRPPRDPLTLSRSARLRCTEHEGRSFRGSRTAASGSYRSF